MATTALTRHLQVNTDLYEFLGYGSRSSVVSVDSLTETLEECYSSRTDLSDAFPLHQRPHRYPINAVSSRTMHFLNRELARLVHNTVY